MVCLDVAGANTASGTNVQQWADNGTLAQQWEVSFNHDDSTYVLTSAIHGKAVDMDAWSTANGGNAIIWVTIQIIRDGTFVDNGYSFLINKHSNKCLAKDGQLHQRKCSAVDYCTG